MSNSIINPQYMRNIAIIAHVDHGKTTLVDQLFRQSGMFRDNEVVAERLMDSMDLERERGITIMSKNGSFHYKNYLINLVDTPGHADFGGQVERVLKMVDGALLLVDAAEGPMPQTFFVLKKALAQGLKIILVINKIDKPAARCDWAVDQTFDLFVKLEAPDNLLDFPVVYASARAGYAMDHYNDEPSGMRPLLEKIVEHIPPPKGDPNGPLQLLVSSLSHSSFFGRMGIGRITSGQLNINKDVVVASPGSAIVPARINKIYRFEGPSMKETDVAGVGEIVSVAGMDSITIGQTFTDPLNPIPLPGIQIDPPTISMTFLHNDSPFAGREGTYVTSRHVRDRLFREMLLDVALVVEELTDARGIKVSGRGELHISILIEKMRREGYEFQVSRPQVIYKIENGKRLEPFEELTMDVDDRYCGNVIEAMGRRKGIMLAMEQRTGMTKLVFKIPTRGLLGFKSEFMTLTRGMGVMNYIFSAYEPFAGEFKNRTNGVMVSIETSTTIAFALFNLQDRGRLFMGPAVEIYEGQIVGEHCRENDLGVNPAKGKALTNMRASGTDDAVSLTPHTTFSLEECIAYINEDELVELTPKSIRMRKLYLKENERKNVRNASIKAAGQNNQ